MFILLVIFQTSLADSPLTLIRALDVGVTFRNCSFLKVLGSEFIHPTIHSYLMTFDGIVLNKGGEGEGGPCIFFKINVWRVLFDRATFKSRFEFFVMILVPFQTPCSPFQPYTAL